MLCLHPGARRHILQYDGRHDWRLGVQIGTWNLGSLSGKRGEVCKELRKRMIYVYCLQEVRWRGQGARMLGMKGRCMLRWSGKEDGVGVAGVTVKEELCEKVVDVRRVSDRLMTVVVFEEDVIRLICGYVPQSRRNLEEKLSFYDGLKYEWYINSADDLVMCLGDFNGHVGRHIDGFDGVQGRYGVGQRKLEVRMLLV